MSRGGGTTLYVTGFGHGTRARDLAFEFERYVFFTSRYTSLPSPLCAWSCSPSDHRRTTSIALNRKSWTACKWWKLVSCEHNADNGNSYGRLVRCDIPAPRTASSRL